jgi:Rps23 Pro-64 3,4-dihydroxylase Tpa1-like proline 4-hydroxylase
MKDKLTDLIVQRLNECKEQLKEQFFFEQPIKVSHHFALDNLLPMEIAERIYANFPEPSQMRLLHSPGELKLKYSYVKNESSLLQDIHSAIQDPKVIAVIEEITGIKNQVPDRSPIAGAVSTLLKGHYINPHLDNSHDVDRKRYQTVNLLYYVSPNWRLENGGNYELWDESIKNSIIVPSLFNRLVVMETNQTSWHAVNPVLCDATRCCVFNYYYSEQAPRGQEYFHTSKSLFFNPLIRPRPEQKIRRAIIRLRNVLMRRA